MRCRAKAEYGNPFSFETFHGIDVRPDDEPIIENILHAGDHHGIGALQPRGKHERTGHLTELHFTGDQRLYSSARIDDFRVKTVLA